MAPPNAPTLRPQPEHRGRADAELIRTAGGVGGSRLAAVLAVGLVWVLATAAQAQTPRFDLVGKLDGTAESFVEAVTNDGRGGGFSYNTEADAVRAFTWSPDGGRVDRPTPHDFGLVIGHMNRRLDRIAVRQNVDSTSSAWRHTFDGPSDLIPNILPQGVSPMAISSDGEYVVGWNQHSSGLRRPFIWDSTSGTRVLPARQGDNSQANGVSDDGRFIVGHDERNNVGWIWNDEAGYTLFPNAMNGGFSNTTARAVSPNGRVVIGEGAAEVAPGVFRIAPMRWIDGVPQSLGFIEGFALGEATGMSDDGSVIVGNFLAENSVRTGFVWTAESGISLLGDYLIGMGIDIPPTPLGLSRPVVSSNGQVLGGVWSIPTTMGQTQGFIAVIPAPSTPLLILTLAPLTTRRRR